MSKQKQFITACTLTFKAFDFEVTMTNGKSTLWNFVTYNPNNDKHYCIFCAPSLSKSKGLIKVALKKLPKEHRLVVVTEVLTNEEEESANDLGFSALELSTLRQYGQEMLEIRSREPEMAAEVKPSADFDYDEADNIIDQAISRDRLF